MTSKNEILIILIRQDCVSRCVWPLDKISKCDMVYSQDIVMGNAEGDWVAITRKHNGGSVLDLKTYLAKGQQE